MATYQSPGGQQSNILSDRGPPLTLHNQPVNCSYEKTNKNENTILSFGMYCSRQVQRH